MSSITQEILDAVLVHLRGQFGTRFAVEYVPDTTQGYRLNHSVGAVLLAFAGSRFEASTGLGRIMQPREVTLTLTVVHRKLNGPQGIVPWLDAVRATLVGFIPPHCQHGLAAVSEQFIGQSDGGLWHYQQDYNTRSMQVEVLPDALELPLIAADFEEEDS